MANEKKYEVRQQQKIDIEANWLKAINFTPKEGELIIYSDLNKIKIGDGSTNVNALSFANGGVGMVTTENGEIFGDYKHNKATDYYAHAEGSHTTAGWRSHTEGYMTYASSTSHAEGRLAHADGKGSHAEGSEAYIEVKVNGENVYTSDSVHIDSNVVKVNSDIAPVLKIGDIITLNPASDGSGFVTTDCKRITDIQSQYEYIMLRESSISDGAPSNSNFLVNYVDDISIGDYVSFTSDDTGTMYRIIDVSAPGDMPSITIDGKYYYDDSIIETVTFYNKITNAVITLHDTFRAENYYEGKNCPNDGYIPSGAMLKQAIITKALNVGSHAEGAGTNASGKYSHTEGYKTEANADCAHAEGNQSVASAAYTHAEGSKSNASGPYSHAEGNSTSAIGSNSHAEGYKTTAEGDYSHAQGSNTVAKGKYSHVSGGNSETTKDYAFAHGYSAKAQGTASSAIGSSAIASGDYSAAQGLYVEATGKSQTVIGQYNSPDNSKAFIIGYGTGKNSPKNIHTIDTKGNAIFTGEVTASNGRLISESEAKALIPEIDNNEEWHVIETNFLVEDDYVSGGIDHYEDIPLYWPKILICNYEFSDGTGGVMYYPHRRQDSIAENEEYQFICGTNILTISCANGDWSISKLPTEDWHVINIDSP